MYGTERVKASLLYLHATAIMLARAVLFPILSSLPPDHHIGQPGCLKVINCAALMLVCIYIIIQLFNVEVVSLATPTKAEPLYKVHTHATPCSQFYDRGCPHLEVILEYFCVSTHNYIFLLYRVSLSEVHCKQEQQQRRRHRYQFFVFFIKSRGLL